MAKNPYLSELKKILNDDRAPAVPTLTRVEIEAAIAAISEALKGRLHDIERLSLVEDRRSLRMQLASLTNGERNSG